MKSDEWELVQHIFLQASEMNEADQLSFAHKQSEGNDAIYQAVISMLEADKDVPDYLDTPSNWSQRFDPIINSMIDAYQILEEIGRGGMGQVYLARDLRTEKQVALKMVQGARYSSRLLKRFFLEQRVMARLDHPNIATLIDVGFWEEDIPYLVMEYVEGQQLLDYCTENKLSQPHRIKLLLEVCDAIQYAHQNRVVHRDLKPSNILVNAQGCVKVLDFGIAKLMEKNEDMEPLTRTGEQILTPAYAAPEQLSGEPITRATDIYMLGMLFHEVLTGKRPVNTENRYDIDETLWQIISTSLESQPSDRYKSAKELAVAIESYLKLDTAP